MRRLALLLAFTACTAGAAAQDFSSSLAPPTQANAAENKLREQANEAMAANDYAAALKPLAALVALHPADAHLLYDKGSAEDALDQPTAAAVDYRAATAAEPKSLAPRVALGLLLARNGQLAEARDAFAAAAALRSEPETDADKALRARALRAMARLDRTSQPAAARDELLEALRLTPETPEDALLSAELAEGAGAGGATAAQAEYRRVLAARPGDPEATAALAHLLIAASQLPEAETLLAESLKTHPGDPAMIAQLAALYRREGKSAEALPLVESLHAAEPANQGVTHLLAGLYLDQKNDAAAAALLGPLASQNPQDAETAAELGRALIHLRRYAEAEQTLARVVAQPKLFATPAELANAAGDLAFAANENNDPAVALRALEVRATVHPPSAPVLFLAAISQDKLHHVRLARQAYLDFLAASNGSLPDQEFEAKHRIVALDHMK